MSTITISDFDREAYERDKEFLWMHCSHNHDVHLLETEEFDLWLVATRSLRAELTRQRDLINDLKLQVGLILKNERRGS